MEKSVLTSGYYNVVYQNTFIPVDYVQSVEIDGKTYEHVFYLKPGEVAAIKVPDTTITYHIRECGVNSHIYDKVEINGTETEKDTGQNHSGPNTNCYSSTSATVQERAKVVFSNHVNPHSLRTLNIKKRLFDADGHELGKEDDDTGFLFRIFLGEDLEYYRQGEYHVKDPFGHYCTYEAGNGFVSTGETHFDHLSEQQQIAATFRTSPSGAVDKIPAKYSVEIRDLLVGTKFKVTEESYDIPLGYGLRTWTEHEHGGKIFTGYKRVEGSYLVEEGDTENSGVIRDNSDPGIEVHNQRGWGIRANKVWSDSDFVLSHGVTYFAVYVSDSEEPLAGTVHKIDNYNYTTYFFPSLEQGKSFSDYHVYEVKLEDPGVDSEGNITYSSITKLQEVQDTQSTDPDDDTTITISGNTNRDGSQAGALSYHVSYQKGETSSSSGSLGNIRTDTVTNIRIGGLKVFKQDRRGGALSGAEFTLREKNDQSLVGTYTSDSDGLVTTLYLPDGEYELIETKTPAGYQARPDPLTITVASGNYTVTDTTAQGETDGENTSGISDFNQEEGVLTIQNTPFTFQVRKVGSGDTPLAGTHFDLYRQVQGRKDYRPIEGYEDLVSGEDGILLDQGNHFAGGMQILPPGTYYLTETQTMDGYMLPETDICFTISQTGGVTLSSDSEASSLVKLEVLSDEESGSEVLRYNISITNVPNSIPIQLKKVSINNVDAQPEEVPLAGAVFTIYTKENSSAASDIAEDASGQLLKDLTSSGETETKGIFFSGYLEPGTYYLEETDVPDGHYAPMGRFVLTVTSSETEPVIRASWISGNETGEQGTVTGDGNGGYIVTVRNISGIALPHTGGPGTKLFTGTCLFLLAAAGLLQWIRRRKI